jgi:enterochelin esterase family protein
MLPNIVLNCNQGITMKSRLMWVACLNLGTILTTAAVAAPTDDVYRLGPDSEPHEGVPQGKIVGPLTLASNVYPQSTRNYWIYVPAQYDAASPAALMIFQDGHAFLNEKGDYRIPFVFDNLIYRRNHVRHAPLVVARLPATGRPER